MSDVVLAVVLFFLVAALFFLTFFSGFLRRSSVTSRPTAAPPPLISATGGSISVTSHTHGLDPSVIESLPKFSYSSVKSFSVGNGALDCYVCLNEFEDDETLRLIPACDHVFHVACIDTWLASNSTCPVCRANLSISQQLTHQHQDQSENGNRNEEAVVHIATSAQEGIEAGPLIRLGSMGKRMEMTERFTLRLPEEVRRKIISGKLRRAATWGASPKAAAGGISRRERGGSYKEESRLGRWLSAISISPRLVSGSKSMESEPAVSGHGSTPV